MIDKIKTLMLKAQKENGLTARGLQSISYHLGGTEEEALEACKTLEEQGFLDIRVDCHCQDGHDMWSGRLCELPEEWYYEECDQCEWGDQSDDPDVYGLGYSLRLLQRDYTRVTVSFMVPSDSVCLQDISHDTAGGVYRLVKDAFSIGHNFRVEVCGQPRERHV